MKRAIILLLALTIGNAIWAQCRNGHCSYTADVGWYLRPAYTFHSPSMMDGEFSVAFRPREEWSIWLGATYQHESVYDSPTRSAGPSIGIRYAFTDFELMPTLGICAGWSFNLTNGIETIHYDAYTKDIKHSISGPFIAPVIGFDWQGLEVLLGVQFRTKKALDLRENATETGWSTIIGATIAYNIPL